MLLPDYIYVLLQKIICLCLLANIMLGLVLTVLFIARRRDDNRWTPLLYGLLLGSLSLTGLDRLLNYSGLATAYPEYSFWPIYLSFAGAPLLFFYVKSRLYTHFSLHKNDFKHFILPTVQFLLFAGMFWRDAADKAQLQSHFFSPFYGNFEKGIFIAQFFLYLYFTYRFILYERNPQRVQQHLLKTSEKGPTQRRQLLILGWLKRLVKGLFVLFGVHASFILTDYFSFKIWGLNLQTKLAFSGFYELSFAAMLFWLSLNGVFAWRRGI